MNIEKIAAAIEKDTGIPIEGLREGLKEATEGIGRITTAEQNLIRSVRLKSGLSQQEFADCLQTPVATLRDWEQGRFTPPGGVLCLLKLINKHPELVDELNAA